MGFQRDTCHPEAAGPNSTPRLGCQDHPYQARQEPRLSPELALLVAGGVYPRRVGGKSVTSTPAILAPQLGRCRSPSSHPLPKG